LWIRACYLRIATLVAYLRRNSTRDWDRDKDHSLDHDPLTFFRDPLLEFTTKVAIKVAKVTMIFATFATTRAVGMYSITNVHVGREASVPTQNNDYDTF
jgi:hypothetical protein